MFRKKHRRLTALLLCGIMALCAGCGEKKSNTSYNKDAWYTRLATQHYLAQDPTTPDAEEEQKKFDNYLADDFKEAVTNDSLTLHYKLRHPETYGIEEPEPTFGELDISDEKLEEDKKELEEDLEELHEFDRELLTADQRYIYDMYEDLAKYSAESFDYLYLYEPFAYTSGLQGNYPIAMAEYKFYTKSDVDTYLSLLKLTPEYFDFYLDMETVKIEKGLFMSAKSADQVVEQCEKFTKELDKNMMVETFNSRIEALEDLTADEIAAYKEKNLAAVKDYIFPAYQKTISFFKENRDKGKNELGLCYLENGKEYYRYLLNTKVGTDKTPEQVIERLEKEISDLVAEMYSSVYKDYEGYEAFFEKMDSFYQGLDPAETIRYFEEKVADRFPAIPKVSFTAQDVHPSLQGIGAPAFYMVPPIDDYENNSIYIDPSAQKESTSRIWSTLAHEGIPGHMYQFTYYMSTNPYPIRLIMDFDGYSEGWATYIEDLCYEYYDYGEHQELFASLSRLNNELNYLVSSRIEIGVNYEGWDLERCKEYMRSLGFGDEIEELYDYVIAEPVNYQMYTMGWLEFKDLKTYAKGMLKEKFDEQEFHKVILDAGPSKFYQLRKVVTEYIESK